MDRNSSDASWPSQWSFAPAAPVDATRELLAALLSSSIFGVAICDRQYRFRAINDALAAMNGIPARAHLGKTLYTVLGKVSEKVLPAFQHVFRTGQPVMNCEITAALPRRKHPGHWIANYLPIRNPAGHVEEVGAVVLEMTARTVIEDCLLRLIDQLVRTRAALKDTQSRLMAIGSPGKGLSQDDPVAFSSQLVENSLGETLAISRILSLSSPLATRLTLSPLAAAGPGAHLNSEAEQPAAPMPSVQPHQTSSLSGRERELLRHLAAGKINKQIAAEMAISIRTVETYRARIMLKLGLHSVPQLVRYAIRNRLAVC